MARPTKYNWNEIKSAYCDGIDINTIVKKYKVAKKTLANKISAEKWEIIGGLNTHINEFKESLERISHNTHNDPIKQEIALSKIETILEDNELIGNNRKLLKAFQGLVGRGIKEGLYTKPQDIKAGVSTIRDIEAVSNPQASKTDVTVNTQVNNTSNLSIEDFYET